LSPAFTGAPFAFLRSAARPALCDFPANAGMGTANCDLALCPLPFGFT
jgi:hypothetical protein